MNDKTHIAIKNVSKIFQSSRRKLGKNTEQTGIHALDGINLEIKEGETLVLLGPSGCGKSTLLRIIGGLEKATQGEILFYGKNISNLPPERRNVGFVFQSYALFPTMTVRENISFGLKLRKLKKKEIVARVDKLLEMMNLTEFSERKPIQLSGGQQQRVSIARALAIEPKVFLLDEPLAALDAKLKEHLRVELARLFHRLGITTIYVTHDQLEAMAIADRIAIMNKGIVEQISAPHEIYTRPKSGFVAQFIGKINRFKGTITANNGKIYADTGSVKIPLVDAGTSFQDKSNVNVFIRPEDMSVIENNESADCVFKAEVVQSVFMGDHCHIIAGISGKSIKSSRQEIILEGEDEENSLPQLQPEPLFSFSVKNDKNISPGSVVRVKIDINKLIVL
jgi:putative spermidine/putrescine transport system ATP-binding protein